METFKARCKDCKQEKILTDFYKDASKKWGYGNRCKVCEITRLDHRNSSKKGLINKAKDGPCTDCGIKYPYYVMDFDHRPGESKLFNISQGLTASASRLGINTDALKREIAKCDLVCSNCHRIRTYERLIK